MRTLLFAAALLAAASPAQAATRNFGITGFTKIRVDGPYKVNLATGVAPFAKATGSSAALDRVAIDVRGDTLVVHNDQASSGGYPGKDAGPVEIAVGTHDLSNAWLNGAGSLSIDQVKGLSFALSVQGSGGADIGHVAADQMNLSLIGNANARLAGEAKKLTAIVRGISTLDAAKLASRDATIGAEGSATIDAEVSGDAVVNATGNATIRLKGRPACTVKATGSTSFSGCR
jgi:hypothetical protein